MAFVVFQVIETGRPATVLEGDASNATIVGCGDVEAGGVGPVGPPPLPHPCRARAIATPTPTPIFLILTNDLVARHMHCVDPSGILSSTFVAIEGRTELGKRVLADFRSVVLTDGIRISCSTPPKLHSASYKDPVAVRTPVGPGKDRDAVAR